MAERYRKRPDLAFVFVPEHGPVYANQVLEGEVYRKYWPDLLERVEDEPEPVFASRKVLIPDPPSEVLSIGATAVDETDETAGVGENSDVKDEPHAKARRALNEPLLQEDENGALLTEIQPVSGDLLQEVTETTRTEKSKKKATKQRGKK